MPRFCYNRGSKDLMLRSCCQPRHISFLVIKKLNFNKAICICFDLTDAVALRKVKNPKIFSLQQQRSSSIFFFFFEQPAPTFQCSTARQRLFCLHRRGGCFGTIASFSSSSNQHQCSIAR